MTSVHDECWPFKTTLCFLQLKKYFIKVINSPDIPFCYNLKKQAFMPNSIKCFRYIKKDTPYLHEKRWLDQFQFCDILLYRRYVDDIICLFNSEQDADEFFKFLNAQY